MVAIHEHPRGSQHAARLLTVEPDPHAVRDGLIFPISPLLLLRRVSSCFPYDLLAEELEQLVHVNATHAMEQSLEKDPTKTPAVIRTMHLNKMVTDFQTKHKNLHIPSELLYSLLAEESIFADLPTLSPEDGIPISSSPLQKTNTPPSRDYSAFPEQCTRAAILKGPFPACFPNDDDNGNDNDHVSPQFLLMAKGISNTELWAFRIEDTGATIDRIHKRPFSLIDPILIPRVSLTEDCSHVDTQVEKPMLVWKERALSIREISLASYVSGMPIFGIRTSCSIQIFNAPSMNISEWKSPSWWRTMGRITPASFNEYVAMKLRETPQCLLLSLKISPREMGNFALLCSDLTIVEWNIKDDDGRSRLHSYDLRHLIIDKDAGASLPVIFEYALRDGRFWIAVGGCFFLLKCDMQAEIIGKISGDTPCLFLLPRGESLENNCIGRLGRESAQVPGVLSSSRNEMLVDQLICFPKRSEWRTARRWQLEDPMAIETCKNGNVRVRSFRLHGALLGIVIWNVVSQVIHLTILPDAGLSHAFIRTSIRIPAVKSGTGWGGFRNNSAISSALPACFVTSQRNAILVDVVPWCFPGSDHVDIHFLQYYSDQEIYVISYRWLFPETSASMGSGDDISLPMSSSGVTFGDWQRCLAAVPRYTSEIPFEGAKQWSFHSASKMGLSKSNFKKQHATVSVFPWFKLFLLLTMGGTFENDQAGTRILLSFESDMIREVFIGSIKDDMIDLLRDRSVVFQKGFISGSMNVQGTHSKRPAIPCSLNELRQHLLRSQLKRFPAWKKKCTFYLLLSLLDELWPQLLMLIRRTHFTVDRNDPIMKFRLSHIRSLLTGHWENQEALDKDCPLHRTRGAFLKLIGLPNHTHLPLTFEGCRDRTSSAISLAAVTDSLFFSLSDISPKASPFSSEGGAIPLTLSKTNRTPTIPPERMVSATTKTPLQTELDDLWELQMSRAAPERGDTPSNSNLLRIRRIFRKKGFFDPLIDSIGARKSSTISEPLQGLEGASRQGPSTHHDVPSMQNLLFSSQEEYASSSQWSVAPTSSQLGSRFISSSQKSQSLHRPAIVPKTNKKSGFR